MIYSGPWLLKPLKNLDREEKINIDNVGSALPPAGKAGTYTFVGGSNLAIWHYQDGCGNFYDAWEFIKFLSTDKDSQKRYANATMMIPASREALEEFITVDPLLKPFRNALVAGYGRSFPSIKEWGEIEGIMVDDLNLIWKIVGNGSFIPDRRRAMVETELEETDETCYWILNHGWKWRIWKHLPQRWKEVILFGSNYLNQMLAIITCVSFVLVLHGLFKRKENKDLKAKIAALEKDIPPFKRKENKDLKAKIAALEKDRPPVYMNGGREGSRIPPPMSMDPFTTYLELIDKALKELPIGKILFNPPEEMKACDTELVEVRITQNITEDLTKGLEGRGKAEIRETKVSPYMKVRLTGSAFKIVPEISEPQIIESDKYTEWQFHVTPLKSGIQTLRLTYYVIINIAGYDDKQKAYKVGDWKVNVKVNSMYFLKCYWQFIVGTLIAIVTLIIAIIAIM